MNVVKVSIIVPVYNAEKYLERCLQSIKVQTLKEIEVILVDDGSTDTSSVICDQYVKEDQRFKVYHMENAGAGYARNVGLGVAQGMYIGFVDSDDYIKPEMFEVMYEASIKEATELIMCSHIDVIHGKAYPYELPIAQHLLKGQEIYDELLSRMLGGLTLGSHKEEVISGYVWRMLFNREFIARHQLHFASERQVQYEDLWFIVEALNQAESILILKDQLYYYCQRAGSLMRSYKEYVWERQSLLHQQLEGATKGKINEDVLKRRLTTRRIVSLLEEIDSTTGIYPFRNHKSVVQRIQFISEKEEVRQALKDLELGNVSAMHKVKLYLLSIRRYGYLYYLTYILCQMKRYKGEVE